MFKEVVYQYTVLPFGLSLAPCTFTKCVDAALSPLGHFNLKVSHSCIKGLAPWKDPFLYWTGMDLRLISRREVVTTDTSNTGWGALCEGRPVFGSWSSLKQCWHNNCLEMITVFLALRAFLPDLKGRHVMVYT